MSNDERDKFNAQLFKAVASLQTPEEVEMFLRDLLTRSELRMAATRLEVAKELITTDKSYRDVSASMPISTTTVTKVARAIKDDGHGGYKVVLDRMSKPKIK